ncbi:MAG: glycosyltransferase [Bacillota bacterium]
MRTVIYPPFIKWNYMMQRPQQLMREFARLGVRSVFHSSGEDIPHPPGFEEVKPNLFVCNQNVNPQEHLIYEEPPVLWISYPPFVTLVDQYYGEQAVIFDCVDAAEGEFADWAAGLPQLLSRADLVFTASDHLYRKYSDVRPHVYLCRNGVDCDHFAAPQPTPVEIAALPRPIIGYHGALASWVDWELIAGLADSHQHYSLVIIGPPYMMTDFPQRPNIHYLGYKPYEQLPAYLQSFDVGLIPFRLTDMTRASCPIKMYEYLAAGLPVVSTCLPEAVSCPEVLIGWGIEGISVAVEQALRVNNIFRKATRQSLARENTWAARAKYAWSRVEELLKMRGGNKGCQIR